MGPNATLRRRLIVANLAGLVLIAWGALVAPALARFAPRGTPLEIAEQIAERHVHGSRDDHESLDEISRLAAVEARVLLTCTPLSEWTADLLRRAGYQARVVVTLTLDDWNAGNNGHTMVSVWTADRWGIIDVDRHVRYTDNAGRGLSIAEILERVPGDTYRIIPLGGPSPEGEGLIRELNRRVFQVAGIREDGLTWFGLDGPAAVRVASYSPSFRVVPPEDWEARFLRN